MKYRSSKVGICLNSNAVVILNFHQKLYAEAQLWSRFFFLFGIKRVGLALMAACSPQSAFHIFFFSPRSRVSSFIAGGHSITTWTKIYPILTSYPSQVPIVDNCEHFTCCISFVHVTKCGLSTYHLPTFLCQHSY